MCLYVFTMKQKIVAISFTCMVWIIHVHVYVMFVCKEIDWKDPTNCLMIVIKFFPIIIIMSLHHNQSWHELIFTFGIISQHKIGQWNEQQQHIDALLALKQLIYLN